MELNALATEFFAGLQLQSLATLLDGIDSILGITIPIPDIPGIGVSFVDLLTANANDLIAALKAQYAIAGDFSFLGFLQPFVSDPLFQGLGIPDYEFGVALQKAVFETGLDFNDPKAISDLFEKVTKGDRAAFLEVLQAPETARKAEVTATLARKLMTQVGSNGVPCLILSVDDHLVQIDPYDAKAARAEILSRL